MKKINKKITKSLLPKIIKSEEVRDIGSFPLDHYSYSSFVKFSTNPYMFKLKYINHETIETGCNISAVIGKAFHIALENYYHYIGDSKSDAIKEGLKSGMEYLGEYNPNYIEFNETTKNIQKAQEIFAYTYTSYITEKKDEKEEIVAIEESFLETIDVEWNGQRIILPIPLKGFVDKIVRTHIKKHNKKMLKNKDYKTSRSFSDPDKIDGAKIIQAIQYYFLTYAKYGEAPYSMVYEEVKTSKNRDGGSQIKEYEIVYEDNPLFFDFYFRFYDDVTRAINGEMVFVPNINDFYDNEVSLISYIYRLDIPEEQAKQMKKMGVQTITELLKTKIEHAGNMRKLMKTAEKKFVSAKSLNYNKMKKEEKIQTKLMEHGMLIKFDSMIEGHTVDLYKYMPSIGLKMSKLMGYVADIEQVIGKSGIRILAPIPNTSLIGFEVPRDNRTFIDYKPKSNGFNIAMGVDIMGDEYRFDIRKAPHMLVAGATGSGKSVFLSSVIDQLSKIPNVDLHLFDPKMVELSQFKSKAVEYLTDPEDIYMALELLKDEMERRYKVLSDAGVRNIEEYKGEMKYKFVVIDEFGDLVMSGIKDKKVKVSGEIKKSILILAQKSRACGIHLIIATQRPSVDIIDGVIKANFPTKVAFRTAKAIDSQVLLDESGAEKLLGRGDMIFSSDSGQIRLQGFSF